MKYIYHGKLNARKQQAAFEELLTINKPFYWRDPNANPVSEQMKAKDALIHMYHVFCNTPCDKKKIELPHETRYIHRLTAAARNLVKKDYWNCCHELSDIFDLEPVFQPQIAYSIKKLLEMVVDEDAEEKI